MRHYQRTFRRWLFMMHKKLTVKAVIELAAPHTWPASTIPVCLAMMLSVSFTGQFSPYLFFSVLLTSIFLQCAVNTLNDYADFVKGTDTLENSDDPTDASIIYNNLNPKSARNVGVAFIALAALSGVYAIYIAGWIPVIFGAVGVAILASYSFSKFPLSHLPIGEIISGVVMGGIIPLASYYVFTLQIEPMVIVYCIPAIISIGLIMMTNNISDIEKDLEAKRKTLPCILKRDKTSILLKSLIIVSAISVCALAILYFRDGYFLIPLMIGSLVMPFIRLSNGRFVPESRILSMNSILSIHTRLNLYYIAMIAADMIIGALP